MTVRVLPILPLRGRGTARQARGGGGAAFATSASGRAPSVSASRCHLPRWGRILGFALLLGACAKGEEGKQDAAVATKSIPVEDTRVSCAPGGAKDLKPDCTREIAQGADGEVWIVRHADGGFRRFVLIDKGTRIATADGAEEVRAERVGDELEVRVGRDRYRFPAAPEAPTSDAAAR
jgi:hypothetical protein